MTRRVTKSEVGERGPFAAAVGRHVAELNSWYAHDALVKAKKAEPYPPPEAHPVVIACVKVEEVDGALAASPDFEWADDTPPPPSAEEVLAKKKSALVAEVVRDRDAASERAWPSLLRPLDEIHHFDAASRKAAALAKEPPGTVGGVDEATIADVESKRAAVAKVERWAAEQLAAVHGLTVETAEGWAPAPLPEE